MIIFDKDEMNLKSDHISNLSKISIITILIFYKYLKKDLHAYEYSLQSKRIELIF